MSEFSKINGYDVKDCTAREGIATLNTSKLDKTDFNTYTASQVTALEDIEDEITETNTLLTTLSNSIPTTATQITYANSGTGLASANVQSAITELKNAVSNVAQGTAQGTSYTNTTSGLVATNVQSAIDEVNTRCNIKCVNGTLAIGETSISLNLPTGTSADALLTPYTSIYGVNPLTMTVTSNIVTMTFEVQTEAVNVKVRID